MKILVCIKQVRDDTSAITIDTGGRDFTDNGTTVWRMNRLDEYALEEAVLIREALPGTVVDAVSVGPERVRATVKKALEKGADNGIHIPAEEGAYMSPAQTAALIAAYAGSRNYDLVLTGVMSEDDMHSQTGSMIAALLGMPCAVSVINQEREEGNAMIVTSELEGGMRERARITMPCLLTIQSGINRPRYPSLSNVMRAKTQEIVTVAEDIPEKKGSGEDIITLAYPQRKGDGEILEGSPGEKAERLLALLHEHAMI